MILEGIPSILKYVIPLKVMTFLGMLLLTLLSFTAYKRTHNKKFILAGIAFLIIIPKEFIISLNIAYGSPPFPAAFITSQILNFIFVFLLVFAFISGKNRRLIRNSIR